jgi:hypothetical protein
VAKRPNRPGNTPVEQQERSTREADANRPVQRVISGPGAADFIAAPGGLDRPGSGTKGMSYTRDEPLVTQHPDLVARPGHDTEATPGERNSEEAMTGSQTGTIGGGGPEAHNSSPVRATEQDRRKR